MVRKRIFFIVLVSLVFCGNIALSDDLGKRILKEMDRALFPENFVAKMRMTNHKPLKEDQSFEIVVYNKEEVGSFMVFMAPPSEKGKKMLLVSNTLWLYVPGTSRAISLSAKQSFMGSTFSNADLMDLTLHDDYDPRVIEEETIDGNPCYVLELTAKDKTVTYSKILFWIRKDYTIPMKAEYYTLSGKLFKTMKAYDLKKIAGRVRPATLTMENVFQKETFTEVELLSLTEKDDLPDSMFTQGYLTK